MLRLCTAVYVTSGRFYIRAMARERTYNHLILVHMCIHNSVQWTCQKSNGLFNLQEAVNPVFVFQRLQASHGQEDARERI